MNNLNLNEIFDFNLNWNLTSLNEKIKHITINPEQNDDNGMIDLLQILFQEKNNDKEITGFSLFKDGLENFNINCITHAGDVNNEIININVYDNTDIIKREFWSGAGDKIVNKQFNGNDHSSKGASKNSKIQKTKRFTKSKRK